MKLSIKDSFIKRDQIRSLLQIWSNLLTKSLMKNFIFWALHILAYFAQCNTYCIKYYINLANPLLFVSLKVIQTSSTLMLNIPVTVIKKANFKRSSLYRIKTKPKISVRIFEKKTIETEFKYDVSKYIFWLVNFHIYTSLMWYIIVIRSISHHIL